MILVICLQVLIADCHYYNNVYITCSCNVLDNKNKKNKKKTQELLWVGPNYFIYEFRVE